MISIKVALKEQHYNVVIGENILKDLGNVLRPLNIGRDAVVITHPRLVLMHGRQLVSGLQKHGFTVKVIAVPEGERSKSARQAFKVIEDLAAYDVKKGLFLAGFGGGVIGDLAGFIAAVYRRGIPYIQVPTTFLAQIDSAIGGKVAIDLPIGKNLVGAFYQPKLVMSDINLLATLGSRQIKNGLAEAVKYGIICDPRLFHDMERNAVQLLAGDLKVIKDVVVRSSRIKARVVAGDEKETRGMRTILNFGHTIGHAIEASQGYRYCHGEAVALGMRAATDISRHMGLLSGSEAKHIQKVLDLLGLPQTVERVTLSALFKHMEHDKKFQAGENRFVLINKIGSVKVVSNVPEKVVRLAVEALRA